MQRGDISNEVAPQWLFVWEDQVATLPTSNIGRYKRSLRMHRYETAMRQWQPHDLNRRYLDDFAWRLGQRFSLVTFLNGPHWAGLIDEWCEWHEIQSQKCFFFEDRLTLARRLATWPSVSGVVDPVAPAAYGRQGYGGLATLGR